MTLPRSFWNGCRTETQADGPDPTAAIGGSKGRRQQRLELACSYQPQAGQDEAAEAVRKAGVKHKELCGRAGVAEGAFRKAPCAHRERRLATV